MTPPKLYDTNMDLVGILDNATKIGYNKKFNQLWTAQFSLPADDPKNELCLPFRIVEIFDGDERVDLFRILPSKYTKDESSKIIQYDCEHVLGTLIDDIMFQYHETTNLNTKQTLEYILSQQTTEKWRMGEVYVSHNYSYKWENENLLGALFSVVKPFSEEFQWRWNTINFPWTLDLDVPFDFTSSYIRYGRNMVGVEKNSDPTNLCTRLYCLGYGEGVNQLTIGEVNSGVDYLESDTIGTYGVVSNIFVDTTEENADTLKAKGLAYLNKAKVPRVSYTINAAHLYQITDNPIDDFYIGTNCQVYDAEDGIDFKARVIGISKSDVDDAPGDITLEISNSPEDIASAMSEVANKQRISEVYSQGSTNIMAYSYTDNCDETHPAVIKFFIPQETVRINKLELNYESSAFRAYSKANSGGGDHRHKMLEFLGGSMMTSGNSTGPGGLPIHYHDYMGPRNCTSYRALINPDPDDMVYATIGIAEDYSGTQSFDVYTYDSSGEHTHEIEYGIYEGETHTAVTVKVDGNLVDGPGVNETNLDIIPYLSKDTDGKILRGAWHEVSITPNDLGRISANIIIQFFIQSRGGGNY